MADLNSFINQNMGKMVGSRGGIAGQCVSLVQAWAEANGVGGTPVFPVAAAKDMAGARSDSFDWIGNTPSNVPQAGDIVVWGTGVGQYGHTAIFVDGNANSFTSFDSNWPVGTSAHKQAHNYNGVVGWLRLKGNNNVGVANTEYDRVVIENYNLGVQLRNTQGELNDARNLLKQQGDRINELQKAVDDANALVQKLQAELVANGNDKAALTKKVEELQKRVDGLGDSTPSTLDSFSMGELLSAAFKKLFKIK